MARKLSPGVHNVRMKNGKTRRVQVLTSGKWKFLKAARNGSSTRTTKKTSTKRRRTSTSTTSRRSPRRSSRSTGGQSMGMKNKNVKVLSSLLGANAVLQMGAPLGPAIQQTFQGNAQGAVQAGKAGVKEAMSQKNLKEVIAPAAIGGLIIGAAKVAGFDPKLRLGKWTLHPLR